MRLYCYILVVLAFSCNFLSSCNQSKKGVTSSKHYFEFDEIEYYNNPISELEFIEVLENGKKSETDSIKSGLLLFNTPKSLSDTSFFLKLALTGYKKKSIDPSKLADINEIFTEKPIENKLSTSCEPMYRNILIFRKNKVLVGIAKICFACMYHQIVGTNANTEHFGQNGDYDKLKVILLK